MVVGILGAMREEVAGLVAAMGPTAESRDAGMRTYHRGDLWGTPAVVAFSRWGKVAAATTATHMITTYGVDRLIFTGVAGGADPGLHVGDIVIADRLVQHDMDARPIFGRHEIPLLGVTAFETDRGLRNDLVAAARWFLAHDLATDVPADAHREFRLDGPRVAEGLIASGDKFFAEKPALDALRADLPGVACVEMEGAAVAQVCHEYGVPFGIVRTLSDAADEHAPVAFPRFVAEVASVYSLGVLRNLLRPATSSGPPSA